MNATINNSFNYMLQDQGDIIPADFRDQVLWTFKVFHSDRYLPDSFSAPNRWTFYKIMLVTGGSGMLIIGGNTYYIDKPVMLFVHPNELISWKNLSMTSGIHCALFKKAFLIKYPQFKMMLDKFGLFFDRRRSVIGLSETEAYSCRLYFERMEIEEQLSDVYREDTIQALLQLLVVESAKAAHFIKPDGPSGEYSHICQFFNLLEKEISDLSFTNPIRIRTVKEFANNLNMHPNYLNVLLKKQTGQNVSVHIRNRLLEVAKTLLLHTDWNLQDIAYCIGFSEQSNFNVFFKKNMGMTPAEFRRSFN